MGDVIILRKKLLRDGRVIEIARKTQHSRAAVLGALFHLWSLADDYVCPEGILRGYTPEDIDREVGIPGFARSLPDDWCEIHGGEVYLPRYGTFSPGVPARPAPQQKKRAPAGEPEIPRVLDTPDFREAWLQWATYRKERRQPLTPTTVRFQFNQLAELGERHAIASIRQSITNGWQGLFPVKGFALPESQECELERAARLARERAALEGPADALPLAEAARRLKERISATPR